MITTILIQEKKFIKSCFFMSLAYFNSKSTAKKSKYL